MRFYATMKRGSLVVPSSLSVLLVLASACGPDVRGDGFTEGITHACSTAAGCDKTLEDAKGRVARCGDPEGDSCIAAREDLASVERLNKRYVAEKAAREEAARLNAMDAAARARAAADAENQRASQERAEDAPTGHAAVVRTALADCRASADMSKCATPGLSAEEKTKCEDECARFGKQRAEDLYRAALRACVQNAEADAKVDKCLNDGRVWAPTPARIEECSKRCVSIGAKLRTFATTKAKCCDGSRSACTNGDLKTDCCDGHGGICPEPKPPYE